jgi:phenylacetic acid degradation operon negative regulatory protein
MRSLYDDFLRVYSPVLAAYRRRRTPVEPARAFTDYVTALTDWRRLPYAEPGLPPEVLPADWTGQRAADTFFELRTRLAEPAHRFVDEIR